MKFSKKMISLLLAAMMVMAMSLTAFAATNVKMYGYMDGAYVESSHTAAFVKDVVDEGDGEYTITFGEANVYGRSGYISSMKINGETFVADSDGTMIVTFEYLPTVKVADGVSGQPIEYSISMSGTAHPNTAGALVIE